MKLLYLVLFLAKIVLEARRKKQMKVCLQSVLVEIFRFWTVEMLILGKCNPPSQNEALFVEQIKVALNTYSTSSENFLLLGDYWKFEAARSHECFLLTKPY